MQRFKNSLEGTICLYAFLPFISVSTQLFIWLFFLKKKSSCYTQKVAEGLRKEETEWQWGKAQGVLLAPPAKPVICGWWQIYFQTLPILENTHAFCLLCEDVCIKNGFFSCNFGDCVGKVILDQGELGSWEYMKQWMKYIFLQFLLLSSTDHFLNGF